MLFVLLPQYDMWQEGKAEELAYVGKVGQGTGSPKNSGNHTASKPFLEYEISRRFHSRILGESIDTSRMFELSLAIA